MVMDTNLNSVFLSFGLFDQPKLFLFYLRLWLEVNGFTFTLALHCSFQQYSNDFPDVAFYKVDVDENDVSILQKEIWVFLLLTFPCTRLQKANGETSR